MERVHDIKTIASALGLEADPLERLLNALVAMELLKKDGLGYSNSPLAAEFLTKNSKHYYGDFILMIEDSDNMWRELDKSIISNAPVFSDNREKLAKEIFTRAMHNNAQAPAKVLSEMIDLKDKKHLLDIGGGSGAFSIILTNKYKKLRATVIEQPAVCKTLKTFIEREGDANRITIRAGNYFEVEFPFHDVALFGQIFHSNSPGENIRLIKKVYSKLEESGVVVITEFVLDENRTGPLFPALFSLNMLIQEKGGKAYSFSEVESWLKEAGFTKIEKRHLVGPHTAIIAYKD